MVLHQDDFNTQRQLFEELQKFFLVIPKRPEQELIQYAQERINVWVDGLENASRLAGNRNQWLSQQGNILHQLAQAAKGIEIEFFAKQIREIRTVDESMLRLNRFVMGDLQVILSAVRSLSLWFTGGQINPKPTEIVARLIDANRRIDKYKEMSKDVSEILLHLHEQSDEILAFVQLVNKGFGPLEEAISSWKKAA